jgi:exodeoxyribonuclease VII large subunit
LKCSVRGSISVYEARGEYQIYVESMEPVGRGALQLAFEQLKKGWKGKVYLMRGTRSRCRCCRAELD